MNNVLKILITISLLLLVVLSYSQDQKANSQDQKANSQDQNLSKYDLSTLKVDDLSDDQVESFMTRAEQSGMTEQQLMDAAQSRGMQPSEIDKLKKRIEKIKEEKGSTSDSEKFRSRERKSKQDPYGMNKEGAISKKEAEEAKDETANMLFGILKTKKRIELLKLEEKIFGFSLFNYKRLDFEPSFNMATPMNYQLGPGDELIIDVWGASQQTYQQKITPEGSILINNLGPIYLGGMIIEEATAKLKKELGKIYSGIQGRSPNTFIKVSLGSIRSIKVNVAGDVFFPGSYTLPSLATVFNAMYAAGGISINGSLRNVKVIRDDKTIAELDFYDFLLRGEQKNNIRLQDQDVVFVSPYSNRVEIKGEVKRPAIYDAKTGETLKDLIYFAGGYTGKAYSQRLKILRKTGKENKVFDVLSEKAINFRIENGDEVEVDSIINRFENRLEIKGAVYHPGIYALDSSLTLRELLNKADGVRGDAFKNRASIYRTKEDLTLEVIPVDLSAVLNGTSDVILQREDLVIIPSIFDIKEEYTLQVEGEVLKPGTYPYVANSTIEDVILQAGGLLESASFARLEVARRLKNVMAENTSNQVAEIYQFQINQDLKLSDSAARFTLKPFDQVFIRRSPGYQEQAIVKVEGEVAFPGKYSLSNKMERISDLIKRAGGLTPEAYPKGARLTRRLPDDEQQRTKALKRIREQMMRDQLKKGNQIKDSLLSSLTITGDSSIGINLDKILANPKSQYDLILQKRDVLIIPKELQTVRVSGEVLYPITVRFDKKRRFKGYISSSGGFSSNAKRSKSYVIYANGSVEQTSKFLFFNNYPKLEPGAEIVVPLKPERRGMSAGEAASLGSAIASLALIIVTIINSTK
jgi:protein involved in polysaccharide export with SLBB domain